MNRREHQWSEVENLTVISPRLSLNHKRRSYYSLWEILLLSESRKSYRVPAGQVAAIMIAKVRLFLLC